MFGILTSRRRLNDEVRSLTRKLEAKQNLIDHYISRTDRLKEMLTQRDEEEAAVLTELVNQMDYLMRQYRALEGENLRTAKLLSMPVDILTVTGRTELGETVTVQALVHEMKETGTVYAIQRGGTSVEG